MAKTSNSASEDKATSEPSPEMLRPQGENDNPPPKGGEASPAVAAPKQSKRPRRGTYRPSHKATFISLAVVIAILAVNAGIITFVLRSQSKVESKLDGQVTISQGALEKLGVNHTPVGDQGIELTVNPNAKFGGNVQIAGDTSIAGQLVLNSKFSANAASLASLQAGKTSLQQLDVNGDGTMTNLNLRKDLVVAGTTRLQGPVVLSQLLTVNNSVNVAGNLSVGGMLAVGSFHAGTLTSDNGIITGGHIVTQGAAPSVSRGSAVGPMGTVTISGNDAAGTVAANAGVGGGSGRVACVTFRRAYGNIPHVVVSASAPLNVYVSRNAGGFCIYAGNTLSPGGYFFDYIVEQ